MRNHARSHHVHIGIDHALSQIRNSVDGGRMKDIVCIEDPLVIKLILTHLHGKGLYLEAAPLPQSRAPTKDDVLS
jgi:hypothetical protein